MQLKPLPLQGALLARRSKRLLSRVCSSRLSGRVLERTRIRDGLCRTMSCQSQWLDIIVIKSPEWNCEQGFDLLHKVRHAATCSPSSKTRPGNAAPVKRAAHVSCISKRTAVPRRKPTHCFNLVPNASIVSMECFNSARPAALVTLAALFTGCSDPDCLHCPGIPLLASS